MPVNVKISPEYKDTHSSGKESLNQDEDLNRKKRKFQADMMDEIGLLLKKTKKAKTPDEKETNIKLMNALLDVGARIEDLHEGSIILIVEFEGLHALQCFWALYESGILRNMLCHEFLTEDFLQSHGAVGADFKVHVKREDYEEALSKSLAKYLAELAKSMFFKHIFAKQNMHACYDNIVTL